MVTVSVEISGDACTLPESGVDATGPLEDELEGVGEFSKFVLHAAQA